MAYSWGTINPAFSNPAYGIGTESFGGTPFAGNISGFNIGTGSPADYSSGVATNAFSGARGLGTWGGMQAVGGIANTLFNQLGNAQGTQAGQDYLDFMADKRDADFGSALFERNIDIADQFRIPGVIANMQVNDPNIRQAERKANLVNLAGKYGQLGGFLA